MTIKARSFRRSKKKRLNRRNKSRRSRRSYRKKYVRKSKKRSKNKRKLYGGAGGGGGARTGERKLSIDFGIITHKTLGDCIKELIEASYNIYHRLVTGQVLELPITIICGGQSPAYYCLAMMNFKIFNPDLVNIVILPHSKGQVKSTIGEQHHENMEYGERLRDKGIILNKNVVIIDGVHSGTGILALESALKYSFKNIHVYKIAINESEGILEIPVNEEIILHCEPKFSDTFPRLVTAFYPRDFKDVSKFITEFINIENNPIAEMIIDISPGYPETKVEDTAWYKLNNEITPEISQLKGKRIEVERREVSQREGGTFKPIVLTNPKRYQCPICKTITGTGAPENPEDMSFWSHNFDCPNKLKKSQE